jgi:uncharacterized protein (DUF1015 family)
MSLIRPFAGLRPSPDKVLQVVSPPYDVVNSQEARAYAAGNPFSFFHISRPEIDLAPSINEHSEEVYVQGLNNLDRFRQDNILLADPRPSFYLYRQRMGNHIQVGLVACASVDEYERGLIKKHELTRANKEDDRTKHIDTLQANDEPVFLTYRASSVIDSLISTITQRQSVYDFQTEDGIGHTFWVIDQQLDIANIARAFADLSVLYIADGHHRSAAALRVRNERRKRMGVKFGPNDESNYFLAVLFPDCQMKIMGYNRVIKDLRGMEEKEFLEKVREKFIIQVSSEKQPVRSHSFGMYLGGQWYTLTAKEGILNSAEPVSSLDVSILMQNILKPVLGIENPRTDTRIDFVGGIRGTEELEKRVDLGECAVAFSLFPTSIDELMAIADANQIMPPKSTWFEPKLRSGLVVHVF